MESPQKEPAGPVHKSHALHTLARGDRVCWPSPGGRGAWGTVTEVNEVHWADGAAGPFFTGITVTLRVPHCPAWDEFGWPVSEPRTLVKTFRSPADVEYAYTPGTPPAPRTVTLTLSCRHAVTVVTAASTGHLLANDSTCPRCGIAQWVTSAVPAT